MPSFGISPVLILSAIGSAASPDMPEFGPEHEGVRISATLHYFYFVQSLLFLEISEFDVLLNLIEPDATTSTSTQLPVVSQYRNS